MRNLKQILLLGTFLVLGCTSSNAQFNPATILEDDCQYNVAGRRNGNDILEYNGDVWEITVYEDLNSNPSIAWSMNNNPTYTLTKLLPTSDVNDPDVVLTLDGNNVVHALVVYYTSGSYILEDYTWNSGYFNLWTPSISFYSAPSLGSSVNIDADYNGNFIIVWEDSGVPYAMTGDVYSGTITSLWNAVPIGKFGTGTFPDVCFSDINNDRVTYCYLGANGHLYVDEDSFGSLATTSLASSITTNPIVNASPSYQHSFLFPRIGCPRPGPMGLPGGDWWTVVVSEHNSVNSFKIRGYTYGSTGLTGPTIYNDSHWRVGSVPSLVTMSCLEPVVSYDNALFMYIGFTMDNSASPVVSGSTEQAIYPVVIPCTDDGQPVSTNYYDVPASSNLHLNDIRGVLSLSGKNGDNVLFSSFYDIFNSIIQSKDVYYPFTSLGSLRSQAIQPIVKNQISYLNSNPSTKIVASVYDMSGKLTLQFKGEYSDFKEKFSNDQLIKSNQMFLVDIFSEDGNINLHEKMFAN